MIDLKPTTPDSSRLRTDVFRKVIREPTPSEQQARVITENDQINHCNETMQSCDDCGIVFENIHDLQNHIKKWCPEQSFKRKREEDEEEEEFLPRRKKTNDVSEERKAFNQMMDRARTDNEGDWQTKVDKYIKDGLSEKEANEKADDRMHVKDMETFYRFYGAFILSLLQLSGGPIHEKVMEDVDKFHKKGYGRMKSIKMALHKRRYQFDAMWDSDKYEKEDDDVMDENEITDEDEKL